MAVNYKLRIDKVFKKISSSSDAFLVTNLKNIRYLTGFTGSFAVLLLTEKQSFLLVDFRYLQQAKEETQIEVIYFKESWLDSLKQIVSAKGIKKLSFEVTCTYETFLNLSANKNVKLVPQSYIVEQIRAVKEEEEILKIKEAVSRAEDAFMDIKPLIKEGVAEKTIAKALEYELKEKGSDDLPFPVIVASGNNSSMPHWRNSDKILKKGDFVIIDWGAEYKGYFSDMTRTFIIGDASEKQLDIYETVNKARQETINFCRAGIKGKELDALARNIIKQAGYEEYFGHATGHGVGLDIHELPKINKQSEENIEAGMVFTIEPGIYIEGLGGVRIEDMIYVKEDSIEILTTLSRDLEIL